MQYGTAVGLALALLIDSRVLAEDATRHAGSIGVQIGSHQWPPSAQLSQQLSFKTKESPSGKPVVQAKKQPAAPSEKLEQASTPGSKNHNAQTKANNKAEIAGHGTDPQAHAQALEKWQQEHGHNTNQGVDHALQHASAALDSHRAMRKAHDKEWANAQDHNPDSLADQLHWRALRKVRPEQQKEDMEKERKLSADMKEQNRLRGYMSRAEKAQKTQKAQEAQKSRTWSGYLSSFNPLGRSASAPAAMQKGKARR